jgi:uncharacterized hydrophobic protein (TIGR00271 family)
MRKYLKLENNQRQGLINKIEADTRADSSYIGLALISSLVATFALLIDDLAVLIGAMLIAPFLTPALGVGMGLIKGDGEMLKRGLINLLIGIIVGIIASAFIALIFPIKELSEAITDRSAPTLVQLAIAVLAGGAAAFSYAYRKIRAVLSGAFVALALVPPISIIGIGLAFLNFELVGGASLLLLANVIGLTLAAVLVFFLFGFRPISRPDNIRDVKIGITWLASLFLIIALPLGYIFQTIITDINRENTAQKVIETQFEGALNTSINELSVKKSGEKITVGFTIRSDGEVDNTKIRNIKSQLENKYGQPVEIDAKLIPTFKVDY